jgi:hypothetical protein
VSVGGGPDPPFVGVPGENSRAQDSSSASSSPKLFVTDIGRHENPDGVVVTVRVVVVVVVVTVVDVENSVLVNPATHPSCRRSNSGIAAMAGMRVGCADRGLTAAAALLVSGGVYSSPQSVPSSSVAFAEFVAVTGGQTKLGASSGSSITVVVTVRVLVVVEVRVVVRVVRAGGQAEQTPLEAQKAMGRQHSVVQHLSSLRQLPPLAQQNCVAGS